MIKEGKKTVCLMALMACSATAQAQGQALASNPYHAIPSRNMFGLGSPNMAEPIVTQPGESPPKILPDGIITIFGRPEVLFKVVQVENSPGKQTRQSYYTLAQGKMQDGVEVSHIDVSTGVVTFNNHGVIQELSLTNFSPAASATKPPPTPSQVLYNLTNQNQNPYAHIPRPATASP